jgi:CheY-like chemotaxis protein
MVIRRLLIADDDEDYVNLMSIILRSEGYTVDCAFNGSDAMIKAINGRYDAVLSDYIMPGIKGDEVAKRIRSIDPNVNIILMTGYKSGIDPSKLTLFNAVLEKPVNPDVILSVLREITRIGRTSLEVAMTTVED